MGAGVSNSVPASITGQPTLAALPPASQLSIEALTESFKQLYQEQADPKYSCTTVEQIQEREQKLLEKIKNNLTKAGLWPQGLNPNFILYEQVQAALENQNIVLIQSYVTKGDNYYLASLLAEAKPTGETLKINFDDQLSNIAKIKTDENIPVKAVGSILVAPFDPEINAQIAAKDPRAIPFAAYTARRNPGKEFIFYNPLAVSASDDKETAAANNKSRVEQVETLRKDMAVQHELGHVIFGRMFPKMTKLSEVKVPIGGGKTQAIPAIIADEAFAAWYSLKHSSTSAAMQLAAYQRTENAPTYQLTAYITRNILSDLQRGALGTSPSDQDLRLYATKSFESYLMPLLEINLSEITARAPETTPAGVTLPLPSDTRQTATTKDTVTFSNICANLIDAMRAPKLDPNGFRDINDKLQGIVEKNGVIKDTNAPTYVLSVLRAAGKYTGDLSDTYFASCDEPPVECFQHTLFLKLFAALAMKQKQTLIMQTLNAAKEEQSFGIFAKAALWQAKLHDMNDSEVSRLRSEILHSPNAHQDLKYHIWVTDYPTASYLKRVNNAGAVGGARGTVNEAIKPIEIWIDSTFPELRR